MTRESASGTGQNEHQGAASSPGGGDGDSGSPSASGDGSELTPGGLPPKPRHTRQISAEARVKAAPEAVWELIADVSRWHEWSDAIRESSVVAGTVAAGAEGAEAAIGMGTHVHMAGSIYEVESVVTDWVPGSFAAVEMLEGSMGPIHYHRLEVAVEAAGDLQEQGPACIVRISHEWAGSVPVFGFLYSNLFRDFFKKDCAGSLDGIQRVLDGRRHHRPVAAPWWSPPVPLSREQTAILANICFFGAVLAYAAAIVWVAQHQIAETFQIGDEGLGKMWFFIGLGSIPGIFLLPFADRVGRRAMLLPALAVTSVSSFACAFAPNIWFLTVFQTGVRVPLYISGMLGWIYTVEEMPAGARGYSVSVLSMSAGLGGGFGLFILPVAQRFSPQGWRVLFALGILGALFLPYFYKSLPETTRFARAWHGAQIKTLLTNPHRRRLLLVLALGFATALFSGPAAKYQNRFIQAERGFSPGMFTIFTVVTTLPGAAGMILGGRLADTIGRKKVGVIALTTGFASQAAMYVLTGPWLWIASSLGSFIGVMWVPAMGAYTTELFPTSLRASAGSASSAVGAASSAMGVYIVGQLSGMWGHLGPAIWALFPFALIGAAIVYFWFPETARQELEDISPDLVPPGGFTGGGVGFG